MGRGRGARGARDAAYRQHADRGAHLLRGFDVRLGILHCIAGTDSGRDRRGSVHSLYRLIRDDCRGLRRRPRGFTTSSPSLAPSPTARLDVGSAAAGASIAVSATLAGPFAASLLLPIRQPVEQRVGSWSAARGTGFCHGLGTGARVCCVSRCSLARLPLWTDLGSSPTSSPSWIVHSLAVPTRDTSLVETLKNASEL